MAITKEQKSRFEKASREDKDFIATSDKAIAEVLKKKKKHPNIAAYYNLEVVNSSLQMITTYLHLSDLSFDILGIKDSSAQEKARKALGNSIILLEEIVGDELDRSLAENRDFLKKIEKFNIRQTLELAKKLLFVYETLVDNLGMDTSKHRWWFVDTQVKIANLIKNMINFTEIEQFRNFRSEFYRDREDLLKLCKKSLEEAAKSARNKYELSTQAPEDIKRAMYLLGSLRMIHSLYGEADEAEKVRTVIDALKARFDQEEKKKEEARNKKK